MAHHRVSASNLILAPAPRGYALLVDYRRLWGRLITRMLQPLSIPELARLALIDRV